MAVVTQGRWLVHPDFSPYPLTTVYTVASMRGMTTTEHFPSDVPALREAITLLRQELAVANGPFIAGGRGLSEEFDADDAIDACEKLTTTARDIDVDGYRVMMGSDDNPHGKEYGGYGVPVDTIGALRAALAAVELAAALVRRDMGAGDPWGGNA